MSKSDNNQGSEFQASFFEMKSAKASDFQSIMELRGQLNADLPTNLLIQLEQLRGNHLGYPVDRYEHCLQTATRSFRDGASEETVVMCLFHDIGDVLAPDNHAEFAAAILKPYLSAKNYWILLNHDTFQGYFFYHHIGLDRDARAQLIESPHYNDALIFAERWDQKSFDPNYDSMSLSEFEPLVRRVIGTESVIEL